MPITAQVEGIGNFEFPDGTDPDVIHKAVKNAVMKHNAPAPLSGAIGSPSDNGVPDGLQKHTGLEGAGDWLDAHTVDIGKGLGETLAQNVASGGRLLTKVPGVGNLLAHKSAVDTYSDLATPANDTQKYAKAVGNGAEGLAVASVAPELELADSAPALSSIPEITTRVAPYLYHAASQGALSKLEGGSNTDALESAAGGVAGQGLGDLIGVGANTFAKKSFGIKPQDVGYGADPADFILNKTGPTLRHPFTGLTPESTERQARAIVNKAKNANEALADGRTIDLAPARNAAEREASKLDSQVVRDPDAAAVRNSIVKPIEGLGTTEPQLTAPARPGVDPTGRNALEAAGWDAKYGNDFNPDGSPKAPSNPLDLNVDAKSGLNLRTGLGHQANYNPLRPDPESVSVAAKAAHRQVSKALKSIPDVGPSIAANDNLIQSGVPVLERGKTARLAPGVIEHLVGKYAAPSLGTLAGGFAGYEHGGAKEAALGALLGGGILSGNPTGSLLLARALKVASNNSPRVAGALLGVLGPKSNISNSPLVETGTDTGRQ